MSGAAEDHEDGYTGPAVLTVDGREVAVRVILDARHEPHDGRLHWFGRLMVDDGLAVALRDALNSASSTIVLAAGGPPAAARLSDVDPWGRYRVTGVGRPPFALPEPVLD